MKKNITTKPKDKPRQHIKHQGATSKSKTRKQKQTAE
jgi:hypothetical protein